MHARALFAVVLVGGLFAIGSGAVVTDAISVAGDRFSPGDQPSDRADVPSDSSAETTPDDPSLETNGTTPPATCPKHVRDDEPRGVDEPRIVELYPNPTTDENAGEFFVLETPPETSLENWTVTDGHTTASFPNETVSERVAVTTDAEETTPLTDDDPLELDGHLRLATDGDRLELRNGSKLIDVVSYDDAPTAERWHRADRDDTGAGTDENETRGEWWPRGGTCLPATNATPTEATSFVLPDNPDVPIETIQNADDRLLIAGYTFTSETVASELVAASERGVDVEVLLESGPVGGTPAPTESILTDLEDAGIDVRATGGEGARYRFHHPKYAVADETVLVTSENWKPSGVGGDSSRGWGISVEDPSLASDLEAVFDADFEGWDTESGGSYRSDATFVEDEDDETTEGEFPTEHSPESVDVDRAELLLAPDNAEPRLIELLGDAEDEILVKQASIGATDVSLVEETVDAARRGVDVRILLDSSWYVEDDNGAIKTELEQIADEEELPLEVTLVEPGDRFEKIHAKGVVIDGETTIVGSLNWNDNSLENNREVLLAVHGDEPAAYYGDVFEADWEGQRWSLPVGLVLVAIVALIAAAVIGSRYITFGDPQADAFGRSTDDRTEAGVLEPAGIEPVVADRDGSDMDEPEACGPETNESTDTDAPDSDSSEETSRRSPDRDDP